MLSRAALTPSEFHQRGKKADIEYVASRCVFLPCAAPIFTRDRNPEVSDLDRGGISVNQSRELLTTEQLGGPHSSRSGLPSEEGSQATVC